VPSLVPLGAARGHFLIVSDDPTRRRSFISLLDRWEIPFVSKSEMHYRRVASRLKRFRSLVIPTCGRLGHQRKLT
jgi:hypothetical protein